MGIFHKISEKIGNRLRGDREIEKERWIREKITEAYNLAFPEDELNEWKDGEMTPQDCWKAVSIVLEIPDIKRRDRILKDIAMKAIIDGMYDYPAEIIQYIQTPETRKEATLEAIDKLKSIGTIKSFDGINKLIDVLLPETDEEKRKRKEEIIEEFESKNKIKEAAFATAVFVQEPERTKRLIKHINQLINNDELLSAKEVVRLLPPGEERYEKAGELILAFAREGRIRDAEETIYENRGAFSDEERQKLGEKLAELGKIRGEFVEKLREANEVIKGANNRRNPQKEFVFV